MSADRALIEQLSDVLQALGRVSVRRMFSGAGLYIDGVIVSLVRGDGLVFFKVDELTRPTFVDAGSAPFTYARKTGQQSLHSYWLLPVDPFDDPDEVLSYGRLALAAARRARRADEAGRTTKATQGRSGRAKSGKVTSSKGEGAHTVAGARKEPRARPLKPKR
jgi:DNA transformation protein and related proteins